MMIRTIESVDELAWSGPSGAWWIDNAVRAANPYADFSAFYAAVKRSRLALPADLTARLDAFSRSNYGGVLLLRGLPVAPDLAATPTVPFKHAGAIAVGSEMLLTAIARRLGVPFSYREWEAGLVIHNKYPIEQHANVQFGSNAVEFMIHTETPFRKHSPDVVALLCLRSDPLHEAGTYVVDLHAVFTALPAWVRQELSKPSFAFPSETPSMMVDGVGYTPPLPVIFERGGKVVYEYVHDLHAVTATARAALEEAKRAVETAAVIVRLKAGDLLLMDNCHIAHGRSAYSPAYDGKDRWLQRMLICSRLSERELEGTNHLVADERINGYSAEYRKVLESLN